MGKLFYKLSQLLANVIKSNQNVNVAKQLLLSRTQGTFYDCINATLNATFISFYSIRYVRAINHGT